jgi:alkanesulfonate monooxygenase SsuD/methylene tetrahydromethanopterin reductase-like flavin-dependent oxidoreductase (luciferase family)
VSYDGEFVHLDGIELDYVHQPRRPKDVPIYIGATGMKMMELAGEIADGVVLNYLVPPSYNDTALAHLAAGAERAGRSVDDLDRPQLIVCSLDDDRGKALDAARLLITQYLGQQPHIMKASGASRDLLEQIAAATEALRGAGLYKPPGVAEAIDWADALVVLGATELDVDTVDDSLGAVLKYREDQARVRSDGVAELVRDAVARSA